MHHDVGRVAGVAKNFTLSELDSSHCLQDEEQNFRVADGSWCSLRQTEVTWKEVFWPTVGAFSNSGQAISFCGLCSAQHESAGKEHRGPISKKRNKYLQSMLIEAANLAPYWNPQLGILYEKELTRGNRNRATLAVARKLVIYMLAVDRRGKQFMTENVVIASESGLNGSRQLSPFRPHLQYLKEQKVFR